MNETYNVQFLLPAPTGADTIALLPHANDAGYV